MKRIFAALLAFVMLSGCSAQPDPPQVELPTEPPESVGAPLAPETEEPTEDEVWVQIEHGKGHANMSLSLPESWQYELLEEVEGYIWNFGIRFRPGGVGEEERLALYFCEEPYGVCGTGLETEEVSFESGHTASVGTYDGGPLWSYISFHDTPGTYIVQNEGAGSWWDDCGDTAMEIIDTIKVGVRSISRERAIEKAEEVCTVDYDRVYDRFDYITGRWMISFTKSGEEGGQIVWIDTAGRVDAVTNEA